MAQQVPDRGTLTGSVDSTQDLAEEELDTRNLLDGFVLRTAQIDQERNRERTDYQYAKKIEEEATKKQFEGRGRPAYDVGRRIAETMEGIDAEYGEEVQSLADMTDTENIEETVKQIVQEFFSKGITIGRIAALLLYCYRLIMKLIASNAKVIIGVGVFAVAAIILYKVFIKIDFFKWIAKKGGMGILAAGQEAGQEAVDAVVRWGWWDYIRNGLGAGVGFVTGRFNVTPATRSTTVTSTVTQTTVQRVTHTVVHHAAQNRVALLFVIPIASIGFAYYWWKKRSR